MRSSTSYADNRRIFDRDREFCAYCDDDELNSGSRSGRGQPSVFINCRSFAPQSFCQLMPPLPSPANFKLLVKWISRVIEWYFESNLQHLYTFTSAVVLERLTWNSAFIKVEVVLRHICVFEAKLFSHRGLPCSAPLISAPSGCQVRRGGEEEKSIFQVFPIYTPPLRNQFAWFTGRRRGAEKLHPPTNTTCNYV